MVRPVLRLPDPRLTRLAQPVGEVDARARALAVDLVATMRAAGHSVGVAAPQIGVPLRAFCIDVTGHRAARSCHGEVVLFDPVIVEHDGAEIGREGCMSVPDLTGDVVRADRLLVRGLDREGEVCELEVDAFEARAVQHELDHLDGLLFLDRLVSQDRLFRRRVYR